MVPFDLAAALEHIARAAQAHDWDTLSKMAGTFESLHQACLLAFTRALPVSPPKPDPDLYNLKAEEAAALTGMSVRWLYEHAESLPYARRHGRRSWRFSKAGIERAARR